MSAWQIICIILIEGEIMQQQIQHLIACALEKLQSLGKLPKDIEFKIHVERTRDEHHGDFASNIALLLAKVVELKPHDLAQLIVDYLPSAKPIDSIEIAGPGFINFYLTDEAKLEVIADILKAKEDYGRSDLGKGKRINVEFVSANPTGPLHVGHGRGAAFGDTIANLLTTVGFQVDREYYVNDAGRQMHVLATSVWLRYLSLFEDLPHFPRSGYQGEYILEIAKELQAQYGDQFRHAYANVFAKLSTTDDEGGDSEIYIDALAIRAQELLGERNYSLIFDAGLNTILADIKQDLAEFGVTFQNWFLESSLDVKTCIAKLEQQGHIYAKDGAKWFRATQFGDEKDRVVVRENGQTTYFAADIGYHLDKFERGYNQVIDVFGADHHGYAPRIRAFLQAEGIDPDKFKVLLVQFAILYRGKDKVQMSTRGGQFVTLRELREEVGNDAARFFYLTRKNDQHLDFDLDLAKEKSADNPVYYIQYAHARICSVMRQLEEKKLTWNQEQGLNSLNLLHEAQEQKLIRCLQRFSETVQKGALQYEPHLLTHFLQELADHFHAYYNAHQFLVEAQKLRDARLCLIMAVKQIILNGLTLLGVSAPESM
jgi:arginyl-tRNA synthetase